MKSFREMRETTPVTEKDFGRCEYMQHVIRYTLDSMMDEYKRTHDDTLDLMDEYRRLEQAIKRQIAIDIVDSIEIEAVSEKQRAYARDVVIDMFMMVFTSNIRPGRDMAIYTYAREHHTAREWINAKGVDAQSVIDAMATEYFQTLKDEKRRTGSIYEYGKNFWANV